MAAAANTAPGAGFPKACARAGSLSNLDSDSAERESCADNPAPGAEFSPSSDIPKMQDGGSLETVASEPCAASREASQCAVTSKKGVIGIGVPTHPLRRKPQSLPQSPCGLFVRASSFMAARAGSRKARRFAQAGVRYANLFELPPSIGVECGGFCKPHLLGGRNG